MESPPSGPNPPEWMQTSEASLADGARKHAKERLKPRSSCLSLFTTSSKEDKNKSKDGNRTATLSPDTKPVDIDFVDKRKKHEDDSKSDQFKWAILYENQRGITMFSTAYYSSRSLLPHDPPAFTVPDPGESSPSRHPHHSPPNVTLATYPLPDPTWRWVSKSWLVDMRDGDVQHDGFEYNWFFRRGGWRAKVGWFNAGGYVRRRRWVRLMMRPSEARLQVEVAIQDSGGSESPGTSLRDFRVWKGDNGDWDRVRRALKDLGRDGPRLDLWTDWLTDLVNEITPASSHHKQWTDDESMSSHPEPQVDHIPEAGDSKFSERPRREWVLAVLWEHSKELHSCFVYPDSRAQLRNLFLQAGLVQNLTLNHPSHGPVVPSMTGTRYPSELSLQVLGLSDFWSQRTELNLQESTEDLLSRKVQAS